ncbi:MAG: tRNA uridine-5-carboxymethylaminomethyl(34) synthesis enzyme MnmG [Spirochaetes bacterium]|nr:tRNA uridine-5-carboxymethylaminomethyl(34) synthesis enzyme MnmG [Spirochaetota bacterium]
MDYDVIVVGGGHAGIEASWAATNFGLKTLLITLNIDNIGQMSCNPSIGGIAKGNIVREIDAFCGLMPEIADLTAIQFRMLNTKKGPAVQSLRVQSDKIQYMNEIIKKILSRDNLFVYQDEVIDLILDENKKKVIGIKTRRGLQITANAIILTTGTFLKGRIFIGDYNGEGGRIGEYSANYLSDFLLKNQFRLIRLKTGTPPRVNGRSINFNKMEVQKGDENHEYFSIASYVNKINKLPQIDCYITRTNENTSKIILENIDKLPLYSGKIKGIGPRYCPSFEDKVIKFKDKSSHLIFVEKESLLSNIYYLNGISTSLAEDLQIKLLRTIDGFENIEIIKPAYAVEYDAIDPTYLKPTLESRIIENLYFAGQINGTSGYEEAAGQGLVAGLNASLKILKKEPYIFSRYKSYIGVMIDDLTTKGIDEPYRMFTSRAEFRLNLRFDNTFERLYPDARTLGLKKETHEQYFNNFVNQKKFFIENFLERKYNKTDISDFNLEKSLNEINPPYTIKNLIIQDAIDLVKNKKKFINIDEYVLKNIQIENKYKGYIDHENKLIDDLMKNENLKIPSNIDYDKIETLSKETKDRLKKIKPENIGQMSRIKGIKQTDLLNVLIYIKKKNKN